MPYTEDYPAAETEDKSDDMLEESSESESEEESEGEGEENTALVPKSVLGGKSLKPGDKIEIEVVHLYEDEAEIKVCEPGEESEKSDMEAANAKMDEYATETA